ncbi:MAG: transposase [Saccharofermentanales bacterium]
MPRQARKISKTDIYHIMLRGINRQLIFEDSEDNQKFIGILTECKIISEYEIYAYCLMGNHIHLLLKTKKENLEKIFKRIGARYVYWYNCKYRRSGHLFQDRFKSEVIDDARYFLTVLRYIHQNPVKAGLGSINYKYSSYNEYIDRTQNQLTDVEFLFEMINIKQFITFNNEYNLDTCIDDKTNNFKLSDDEAKKIIIEISNCKNLNEFQNLDIKSRNENIRLMKKNGLSIRQINRLTGISKGIVERVKKNKENGTVHNEPRKT